MFEKILKVVVVIVVAVMVGLMAVYITKAARKPTKVVKTKCPPCKCECKCKKPPPPIRQKPVAHRAKPEKPKTIVQKNANSLYLLWWEDCEKKGIDQFVNLIACVRWNKLKKYLNVNYADEAMIVRRQSAHLIFDRLGKVLCTKKTGDRKKDKYVTEELAALYGNTRKNIRKLERIKKHNPTLKIPSMKMCIKKDGKYIWGIP